MKGAWFILREGGIFKGKIFCIKGLDSLHYEWKYMLNEKISQVLTSGFLSSKKEVEVGYGKDSRDDDNSTQGTSLHPLVCSCS